VNYFYGTDNRLVKRERYLDQVPANTTLEELLYYENGRIFSKASRHHPLKTGREDHSQFDDPNAPEFGSVEELPFPEDADAEWPLAMRDLSTPFHKDANVYRQHHSLEVVAPFRAAPASMLSEYVTELLK
jgi:hypothetical protein